MIKKLLLFTLLLPIKFFSQQSTIANPYIATNDNIKSPQVHLLKQFADYPVDISRGLVDVNIPLYEINFGDIKVPLGVKFHASGLKADVKENGILGLKWVLNIGGFISREVRGYPDELLNHKQGITSGYSPDWITLYGGSAYRDYLKNNIIFQSQDFSQIGMPGVYGKYEDTEYDIFTFSLPNGKSGKFILKDTNGEKNAAFLPYQSLKVKYKSEYLSDIRLHITELEITDDNGYVYKFGKNEDNNRYYETMDQQEYNYINCWLLNSITAPNKKDIIRFEYNSTTVNGNSPLVPVTVNDQLETGHNYFTAYSCGENSVLFDTIGWDLYLNYVLKYYNMPPYSYYNSCYLTKITYNGLVVNFNHQQNANNINGLLLDNIEIVKDNQIFKKIDFDVTNTPVSESTNYVIHRLKNLTIRGSADEVIEKYSFDYYDLHKLTDLNRLANSADYWGYYNSQVSNVILKDTISVAFADPIGTCTGPSQLRYFKEIGAGQNRFSNPEDMKIGMLKSITYPTGGITLFDYEGNQYKNQNYIDGNFIKNCGGLRIKTVIEKDSDGKELKRKEFRYGNNEDGVGIIPTYLQPDKYNINEFEETATEWKIDDQLVYYSGTNGTPAFRNQSADAIYRTRYFTGFFPSRYYTFLDKLVHYDKVTEYYGDTQNNIGKTENYYSNNFPQIFDYEFDTRNFKYQRNKFIIDPSNFWYRNHLTKKIDYKKENSNYLKIKQTDYTYQEDVVEEINDLSIFTYKRFYGFVSSNQGDDPQGGYIPKTELERVHNNPGEYFGYKTQKYIVGKENLIGTTEKFYFNNDSIVQTTKNIYDTNKPTFLRESKIVNSKGKDISQKYLYPFDINAGVYNEMTIANVISPVVEKVSVNDTNITGTSLLTYKKSDNNFVPDKNYMIESTLPIPASSFNTFTGLTKDTHYNTDPESTFDSYDDYGNLTQVTLKGDKKICFIWGYDKKYPVAKIENMIYANIPPDLITAIETASSATGLESDLLTALNNLRNHAALIDAMVTTFTYKPLIGMTSMTDPKGYISYYEYDTYGRLKQVKDKDRNVLSANAYHYKNQ